MTRMVRIDRSDMSLVAVCDCGAREFVGRAFAAQLDAWIAAHARGHEASDERDRAVAASLARARRHADEHRNPRET